MKIRSLKSRIHAAALLTCLFLGMGTEVSAQSWHASLTIDPYPSPYLTHWQTDPTLATLEIQNLTDKPDVVIADLTISETGGALGFQGNSRRILINPDETIWLNNTGLTDWYTGTVNETYKQKATRTGMLPEGDYEVCVTLRNQWGNVLVEDICAYFTIVHPEAPELIYPIEEEPVYEEHPVFQWIPPTVPSDLPILYSFCIVELLDGQSPSLAIDANYPQAEYESISGSTFEYPLDALPLEEGKIYVWRIRALDLDGRALTNNNGFSDIGMFTRVNPLEQTLTLTEPEDRATVIDPNPTFSWEPLLNFSGTPLYYHLKLAEIPPSSQLLPEEAMRYGWSVWQTQTTESEVQYPLNAPALEHDHGYAWQVQAVDGFGNAAAANNGFSEARAFTTDLSGQGVEDQAPDLPEILPLPDESVAYLQLKRAGNPLVNYTVSSNGNRITLNFNKDHEAVLFMPAFTSPQTNITPYLENLTGRIVFEKDTRQIISGTLTANPVSMSLSEVGLPLELTGLEFTPSQNFQFTISLILFGQTISSQTNPLTATLDASGNFCASISNQRIDRTISLVENSDKLRLYISNARATGNQIRVALPGMAEPQLILNGEIRVKAEGTGASVGPVAVRVIRTVDGKFVGSGQILTPAYVATSVELRTNGTDVIILDAGDPLSFKLTPTDRQLFIENFMLTRLAYFEGFSQPWSFQFTSDMRIQISSAVAIDLPTIPDVLMTEKGLEIPFVDLAVDDADWMDVNDVRVRPYAYRQPAYTYDWYHDSGQTTWPDRFDVEIDLNLPDRLSQLDVPYTANNVLWSDSAFTGAWTQRNFLASRFAPFTENQDAGLQVHRVAGRFANGKTEIEITADLQPPSGISGSGESLALSDPFSMDAEGYFTGQSGMNPLSDPMPWGTSGLSIGMTKNVSVELARNDRTQEAALRFDGEINLPSCTGSSVTAAGQGILNLLDGSLQSGTFEFPEAYTLCFPASDPVFRFDMPQGGKINETGLLFNAGDGVFIFNDDSRIPCTFSSALTLSLPAWQPGSGDATFDDSFALELSNFYGDVEAYRWHTLSQNLLNPATSTDRLDFILPGNVRMENGRIKASGESQTARFVFRGQGYESTAQFSSDFEFTMSPTCVSAGRIDFIKEGETIATLDPQGLHLGVYFGTELVAGQIVLPNAQTAYIPLDDPTRLKLVLEKEGDLVKVSTMTGETVPLVLPTFSYGGEAPSVQIVLNELLVDPRTGLVKSGSDVTFNLGDFDLKRQGIMLAIPSLTFTPQNKLEAVVNPILPGALQSIDLHVEKAGINTTGLASINDNYNSFSASPSPRDSVVHGSTLKTVLDGMFYNQYNQVLKISGNFKSPFFGDGSVHFIMTLDPQGAAFEPPAGTEISLQTGCATLEFIQKNGRMFEVSAPLDRDEIQLGFAALLTLSNGLDLTLQDVQIDGQTIAIDPGSEAQQTRLFGADLAVTDIVPATQSNGSLHLSLNGTLKLFNQDYPVTGLEIGSNCSISDKVLYTQSGSGQGGTLAVSKIETQNGQLRLTGNIGLPDPFDSNASEAFTLQIDPDGNWIKNGSLITESVVVQSETEDNPEANLGTDEQGAIKVPIRLARLALEKEGDDNSQFNGSIQLTANTYWPNPIEDQLWQIDAAVTLSDQGDQVEWSVPTLMTDGTTANPATIPVNNVVFNTISDLSVDDPAEGFTVVFTNTAGLPDDAIIVGGELEFKENILRRDYFEKGRFTACEFDLLVFKVSISNIEFFRGKDGETRDVDISDITFSTTKADVTPKTIKASTYFRVSKAILDAEFMKASGGVDEFRWIDGVDPADNKERQILFIKNANIEIEDQFGARIDLIADIKDANEFKFLLGGSAHFECFSGDSSAYSGVFVGMAEMKDGLPGFGAFIALNWGADYYPVPPIPISLTGVGGGIFVNTTNEVDDLVRTHLGLDTNSQDPEFVALLDKIRGDDPRTFAKIMLYAEINIPSNKGIKFKGLVTLATDRLRIDLKVSGITSPELKKYLSFSGLGFVEAAWRPNFSGFDYLAGDVNIAGTPKTDGVLSGGDDSEETSVTESLIKLPDVGTFKIKFVIASEAWAVHGLISSKTPFFYNEMEAELALSNYGFFVRGKYAIGFDLFIVKMEAGLELAVYVFNQPNTTTYEWGGYGNAYVEASLLGGWLASARGDLYIGMFAENADDFYLFGAAMLRATVLGISKEMGLWAKWESDGGFDAGTGIDEEMMERIADCRDKANQIVAAATGIGGLDLSISDADIAQLQQEVDAMVAEGRDDEYEEDIMRTIEVVRGSVPEKYHRTDILPIFQVTDIYDDFTANDFNQFRNFSRIWFGDLQYAAAGSWDRLAETLNNTSMDQQLTSIDVSVEELAAAAQGVTIQKAYTETSESVGGLTIPLAEVDPTLSLQNQQNVQDFQDAQRVSSLELWNRIKTIKSGREAIYSNLSYEGNGSVGKKMGDAINTIDITRMMGESQEQSETLIQNMEKVAKAQDFLNSLFDKLGMPQNYLSLAQIMIAVNREWRELSNEERRAIYATRMNGLGRSFDYISGSFSEEEYKRLAIQTYYHVPILLVKTYNVEIAKMYNSIGSAWQNGQSAFDNAAAALTQKTDGLWDKYLDLSESYHKILTDFNDIYTDSHISQAASDSAETFLNTLKNEFTFPNISVTASVYEPNESSYFRELQLGISATPANKKWAETQLKIGNNTFSIGGLKQLTRYAFLYPGVYCKTTSLASQTILTDGSSVNPTIGLKLRNQAGNLAVWPKTYTAHMSYYKKSAFSTNRNTVSEQSLSTGTKQITLSFPGCYHDTIQNKYVTGVTDTLGINWILNGGTSSLTAKYELEIQAPNGSINKRKLIPLGSKDISPTSLASIISTQSRASNVDLDSQGMYRLTLRGYALDGSLDQEGSANLYVGTSVPVITGHPQIGFSGSWTCWIILPGVTVTLPYGGTKTVGNLEVKIVESGQSADSVGWAKVSNLRHISNNAGIPERIYVSSLPYKKSFKLYFRASNPLWQTGYSNVATFNFQRIPETDPPQKAVFDFISMDESGNTTLRVRRAPSDSLSGFRDLKYRITRVQGQATSSWRSIQRVFPSSEGSPTEGMLVTLPTGQMSQNLFGSLIYTITTYDNDGNRDSTTVTTKTYPRPPQEIQFYLDGQVFVCEGQFDVQMVQDAVRLLSVTIMNTSDSLAVDYNFANTGGQFWYTTGATQSYQIRRDVAALLSAGEPLQIIYRVRNYNFYQQRNQFSEIRRQQARVYSPMFTTVLTNEEGKLVIPIANEAFDGTRQADYYIALGQLQNNTQNYNLRAFPNAPDFRSVQVLSGSELEIPFDANDCWPQTLVSIKAIASDGSICITHQMVNITPKTPWLATAPYIEKQESRYLLKLTPGVMSRIFSPLSAIVRGSLDCSMRASIEGEELSSWPVQLSPQINETERQRNITQIAGSRETIYLIVKGVTSVGAVAQDSCVYRVPVPAQ